MTDHIGVAESYSGTLRVRSAFKEKDAVDFDSITSQEVVDLYNKINGHDSPIELVSEAEVSAGLEKHKTAIDDTIGNFRRITNKLPDLIKRMSKTDFGGEKVDIRFVTWPSLMRLTAFLTRMNLLPITVIRLMLSEIYSDDVQGGNPQPC